MLDVRDITRIEHALRETAVTVFPVLLSEGRKAWVKRATMPKAKRWHTVQTWLSRMMPIPLITVTVSSGGPATLMAEARRLKAVKEKRGVATPDILFSAQDYLVLADSGEPVLDRFKAADESEKHLLLELTGRTLRQLHNRGGWHGRPALKDFLWRDGSLTLIDLEEELEAMPLAQRQARDILLFLHNMARFGPEWVEKAGEAYAIETVSVDIAAELRCLMPWLKGLRLLLSPLRQRGGRDFRQAFAVVDYLLHAPLP